MATGGSSNDHDVQQIRHQYYTAAVPAMGESQGDHKTVNSVLEKRLSQLESNRDAMEKRLIEVEQERDVMQQTNLDTAKLVDTLKSSEEQTSARLNDAVDRIQLVLGQQDILESLNVSLKSIAESLTQTRASFTVTARDAAKKQKAMAVAIAVKDAGLLACQASSDDSRSSKPERVPPPPPKAPGCLPRT